MNFKDFFEQAPFSIVITNAHGTITLANKACCDMLGYPLEELLTLTYKDVIHPNYQEAFDKEYRLLFSGEVDSIQMAMQWKSKHNQLVNVIYKANRVRSQAQEFYECAAEVIETKTLTTLLTPSAENDIIYLNSLMERSPDIIYFKNRKSQLIKVSNSFKEKFNSITREVIGKTDFDLFTREHAQTAFDNEQHIIKTGLPIIDIEEKETILDGNKITWVSTSKMPLRNELGAIIGTFGISRDITFRKLQEAEIKEKNNILNAITSNMPVVVYKYSKADGITPLYGSPNLVGVFEKSKMVKLSISEGVSLIINKISTQKDNQGYLNFPSTYYTSESECYFDNFVFKSESDNSDRDAYIGLALDITSYKLTQQNLKRNSKKLEKINEELNQFSYIVSHDLKAPLRAVTNLSEWIEEDLKEFDNEETKTNLKLMRGRVRRMENLINGILIYSRVSRAQITLEEVNVGKLLYEIIDSLSIPKEFTITLSDNLPVILYPAVNLEQIFSNLISNAIKYHHKPTGHIEIGYRDSEDFYEFEVSDDGPGIAKEYHGKIFQIFQTLQARDTMESTGIGLTIVKKIVEERGGSIWLESALNKGTKFIFTIPKKMDNTNLTNQPDHE